MILHPGQRIVKGLLRFQIYSGIYRLPFNLVLKISKDPSGNEAAALRLLIDHASARSVKTYLLTTWIDGDCVADVWGQLTAQDKARIATQLREQFTSLHEQTANNARAHATCLCFASGAPVADPRIPWLDRPRIFSSSKDVFEQLWVGLDRPWNADTVRPALQPLIERADVPVVFSHGDILRKNLVLTGGLEEWRAGSTAVCLIDWEYAGWMPQPWDALKATWMAPSAQDEWFQLIKEVFPESSAELEADWLWRSRSRVPIVADWEARLFAKGDY
ncbi:protein kinase subdomain-containing protein PKL [Ganoderma leucocontextum]|nr:protein kinase subdomain-containing protein PKL [Ganoderma leucocontextum]